MKAGSGCKTLLAAVPLLFIAAIVVGVGYFLARIVSRIVASFLEGVGGSISCALDRGDRELLVSATVLAPEGSQSYG